MIKTHWKKTVNPDYLGAYALDPGQDMILTIKEIKGETVTGQDGKKAECAVAYFAEGVKPMILNRTNMRTVEKIYKTPYIEDWIGKRIQIYATTTRLGRDTVECLRIRNKVPNDTVQQIPCGNCGQLLTYANGMEPEQLARYTKDKYNKALCAACAIEAAKAMSAQEQKGTETTKQQEAQHDA